MSATSFLHPGLGFIVAALGVLAAPKAVFRAIPLIPAIIALIVVSTVAPGEHMTVEWLGLKLSWGRVDALAVVASARPNQTGRGAGAEQSTAPGTTKPAPVKTLRAEPGTDRKPIEQPNRAHIMNQVSLSSTCALVQFLHLQDIQTAGREATLDRWRADGVTADALQKAVAAARSVRAKAGSTQPVNVGLLDRILSSPPPGATRPRIGAALGVIGTAQGCPPRPGGARCSGGLLARR